MAAYITVLNYVYSLCVFYYSVLSCVADVADCPLQHLSATVIKNTIIIIIIIIILNIYTGLLLSALLYSFCELATTALSDGVQQLELGVLQRNQDSTFMESRINLPYS